MCTGDDWEHEETFTDDDEAVGNDPEEREEQVPEGPAPPEIKQVSRLLVLAPARLVISACSAARLSGWRSQLF